MALVPLRSTSIEKHKAWLAGRLDAARQLLDGVLQDARENQERNPDCEKTKEVIETLEGAFNGISKVSNYLVPPPKPIKSH